MALDIKAGIYKGRIVKQPDGTWAQYGMSTNDNPEMILDADLKIDDNTIKRVSTALYFSPGAAPHSFDRLRSCGWTGTDVSDLTGVDKNEVSFEIRHEPWTNDQGVSEMKTKVQIMGGGRFSTAKPVDAKSFAARVAAIAGTAPPAAAVPKPGF